MLNLSEETERLARLVAVKTGKTPQAVVHEAVATQARTLGVVTDTRTRPVDMAKIDAITRRSSARPIRDVRDAREILDEAWGEPA